MNIRRNLWHFLEGLFLIVSKRISLGNFLRDHESLKEFLKRFIEERMESSVKVFGGIPDLIRGGFQNVFLKELMKDS